VDPDRQARATVGIVIPTLNEATHLPALLGDVQKLSLSVELVVVDGGSTDHTPEVARAAGARVITAGRGRASQMNAGAAAVAGDWLCFLHADVRMLGDARETLERAVGESVPAAVWRLAIDAAGVWPRFMEVGARVRDRVGGLPYGDQGLLVRRSVFEAVGGYREIPLMEDVAMIRALRRRGRLVRLGAPLRVSPRRWVHEGPFCTWLRNSLLVTAFLLGVRPERLARWYRSDVR
jgi:rSAM/selenodomain-associated transferase 2